MKHIKIWLKVFTLLLLSTLFFNPLHAVTFDWETEGGGWTAGDLFRAYTNVAGSGIDMNVTITGETGELVSGYPATDANGLNIRVDYSDKSNFVIFTMNFSTPIKLTSLKLKDFDTSSYIDRAILSAVDKDGNTVVPSGVILGSDVKQNIAGDYEAKPYTNNNAEDPEGQ